MDDSATENVESKGNPEETFVEFTKFEVVSPEHPAGAVTVDFLKPDKEGVIQTQPVKIKEGCTVGFRVTMRVYNDTVLGLDFRGDLKYKDMKSVQNWDMRLGSYAPLKTAHVVKFVEMKMPSGFFYRTNYTGTGQFVDSEDRVHMMFRFTLNCDKEW